VDAVDAAHETLAARIRALAEARGLPLSHVADRAGVGRAHLYSVLAGRSSPSLTWIVKIAEVLGVEPAELLTPIPAAPPNK
jgi:transcriptional regulator with XRE-family HTH domain